MVVAHLRPATCTAIADSGSRCRQFPAHGSSLCFWHDPAHAAEATEARRLGGLRRRREHTVTGAYDFQGLDSVPAIRRLLEIAALDALGLDNSLGRVRSIVAVVGAATNLLRTGELESRIETLESALANPAFLPPSLLEGDTQDGIAFEAAPEPEEAP
jgi:hypothetical protein